MCVDDLNLNAFILRAEFLMFNDSGTAKCSISLTVCSTQEHIRGRNKQSKAETNTLAATSSLVLQPGHHLEM